MQKCLKILNKTFINDQLRWAAAYIKKEEMLFFLSTLFPWIV